MEITIIETKERTRLSITDPKSVIDWTNDLLGNHNALPDYDDEDGTYHMSQDDYNWWAKMIDAYQQADNRSKDILDRLSEDDYDKMIEDMQNIECDLEDLPDLVNSVCDIYDVQKED